MSSNRWSSRRRVFRRPPVCISKPKANQFAAWPAYVLFTYSWLVGTFPPNISQASGTFKTWTHVTGTRGYINSGTDLQGNTWSSSFLLYEGPASSTLQITITSGPKNGTTLVATAAIAGPLTNFTFPVTAFVVTPAPGSGSCNGKYP